VNTEQFLVWSSI